MAGEQQDKQPRAILYVLEGDPIPLARCRIARNNKRVFDPQKTLKLVSELTLKSQHRGGLYKGPLRIEAFFYFHIPKTRKDLRPGDFHRNKPDGDNLLKMLYDVAAHGVLFHDDCQIAEGTFKKCYSDRPRTEFIVIELEKHGKNGKEEKS